jgi:hypothetical protein
VSGSKQVWLYGGDYNHQKLQALTEDVLINTIKLCPNAKKILWEKAQPICCDYFLSTAKEGRIIRNISRRISNEQQ